MNSLDYSETDIAALYQFITANYPPDITTKNDMGLVVKTSKIRILEAFETIKLGSDFNPTHFNWTLKSLRSAAPGIWRSLILPYDQVQEKIYMGEGSYEAPILKFRLELGK